MVCIQMEESLFVRSSDVSRFTFPLSGVTGEVAHFLVRFAEGLSRNKKVEIKMSILKDYVSGRYTAPKG